MTEQELQNAIEKRWEELWPESISELGSQALAFAAVEAISGLVGLSNTPERSES